MIRKIIKIDESKCDGCGICAEACHEEAIGIVDGKAKLLREDYCDGLGDCLPACPTGAITFEEREAPAYDHEAVMANKARKEKERAASSCPGSAPKSMGCPGSRVASLHKEVQETTQKPAQSVPSRLSQWPVQIQLVPTNAQYFDSADLLISADCCAYAYGNFHNDFIKNKVTVIGCPKLDDVDYSNKLTDIIAGNNIKSVTIVRMEVPCCGGIELAAKKAIQASGKFIPWQVVTVSLDGEIIA